MIDDWRRVLDGPDGRELVAMLSARLGVAALPRIEDSVDGQEEILGVLRGEAAETRRVLKDLAAQLEDLRKQTLAWRRGQTQDLRGVPKPVPRDPDHPTDDEVEREIVHQLYQKGCWGAKYGQYEKLKRGYNSKAGDKQVRAAVRRLEEKRWIMLYPKDTDQFRLNPANAEAIYKFLGVADRAAEQLAEETREEIDTPALTKRDLAELLADNATRQDVERAIAPVRSKVASLEASMTSPATPALAQPAPRASELADVRGMLQGLQGEMGRLKKLAEETAVSHKKLAERVNSMTPAA